MIDVNNNMSYPICQDTTRALLSSFLYDYSM